MAKIKNIGVADLPFHIRQKVGKYQSLLLKHSVYVGLTAEVVISAKVWGEDTGSSKENHHHLMVRFYAHSREKSPKLKEIFAEMEASFKKDGWSPEHKKTFEEKVGVIYVYGNKFFLSTI